MISVITITGIGDHLRPEWPITFTGIRNLGNVVAEHPVLEGRRQYRIDRSHRTGGSAKRKMNTATGITIGRIGDHVPHRPLAIYQAIGAQLASAARP